MCRGVGPHGYLESGASRPRWTHYHIPREANIIDLATRVKAGPKDVGPESEWMLGPKFLTKSQEDWPSSQEFFRDVPVSEMKFKVFMVKALGIPTQSSWLAKI